jgi:hypothetical protein
MLPRIKGNEAPSVWTVPAIALGSVLLYGAAKQGNGGEEVKDLGKKPNTPDEEENAHAEAEAEEEQEKSEPGWVAIFLDEESRKKLREAVKATHGHEEYDHLTLLYDPSEEEYEKIHDTVGKRAIIRAAVVGKDEASQALCAHEILLHDEESGDLACSNDFPHVTISHSANEGAARSNDLLSALHTSGHLSNAIAAAKEGATYRWNAAELGYQSGLSVETMAEPLELSGTICTNFRFNYETRQCSPPAECGFCTFMRGGPCGDVFTEWEACIDKCKDDDSDFVELCGEKTVKLKECVDAHPEYYGVLSGE